MTIRRRCPESAKSRFPDSNCSSPRIEGHELPVLISSPIGCASSSIYSICSIEPYACAVHPCRLPWSSLFGDILLRFPKLPLLPCSKAIHRPVARFTRFYGGVVQPSLRIYLAALPEVRALCLWGDMRTVCLQLAGLGTGGGASATVADTRVACVLRSRRSVIKI